MNVISLFVGQIGGQAAELTAHRLPGKAKKHSSWTEIKYMELRDIEIVEIAIRSFTVQQPELELYKYLGECPPC